jgi:dTMP kinase
VTREPGGTEAAEAIRALLVEGEPGHWLPLSEALLHIAARADHLARRIRPALAAGRIVLCDRFHDSTRVYQGLGDALGLDVVDRLLEPVLAGTLPDLTLVLDLPVATGLARRRQAGALTGHDRRDPAFHERVRRGFLELARLEPERLVVIDATGDEATVAGLIRAALRDRFPEFAGPLG